VVDDLKAKGAVFVEELDEIPETDQPVIFSAHGVPQSVPAAAKARKLFFVDAICPLVSKVHVEARAHHAKGLEIALIGHAGHPEVLGTLGQLPVGPQA
jgi:4-hydroxy-3-methylbut-2-enyl diphosphate reductase